MTLLRSFYGFHGWVKQPVSLLLFFTIFPLKTMTEALSSLALTRKQTSRLDFYRNVSALGFRSMYFFFLVSEFKFINFLILVCSLHFFWSVRIESFHCTSQNLSPFLSLCRKTLCDHQFSCMLSICSTCSMYL